MGRRAQYSRGPSFLLASIEHEDGEQVPVIAVVSPYFDYGSPGSNRRQPTLSVLVVVNSSTTTSFHMAMLLPRLRSLQPKKVQDVSTIVAMVKGSAFTWRLNGLEPKLEQRQCCNLWKSYEGATAWEAAAQGSQYLKTIVPISGTTALGPLLYKNGSAELEVKSCIPIMADQFSTMMATILDNLCGDVVEGFLAGPTRYGLGELDPYMDNYYDERSHIDKALGKYNGSIYWVQGLQDWNVDPPHGFRRPSWG